MRFNTGCIRRTVHSIMTDSTVGLPLKWRLGVSQLKKCNISFYVIGYTFIWKMSKEQEPPLEVEVLKWDAHSFTIVGVNEHLEKLLKEQKIIRILSLRHNGQMGRLSRDVRLIAKRDYTSEIDEGSQGQPIFGTTFDYEGLDWLELSYAAKSACRRSRRAGKD